MHTCQARRGLAHCECHAGFLLAADRRSCEGELPLPVLRPHPGAGCGGARAPAVAAPDLGRGTGRDKEPGSPFCRSRWEISACFSVVLVSA